MKLRKSLSFKLIIAIVVVILCFFLFSFLLVLFWRKKSKRDSSFVSTIELLSNVSYKMLYQATNGFSPSNLIGTGSYGLYIMEFFTSNKD